jgi:ABC-type ATPase with predicted acetyltransferase domain
MLKLITKLVPAGVTAAAAVAVFAAEIDLTEFDTLLMQDMDETVKDLEPLIGAKNAAGATEAVVFLGQGLEWTEQYFLSKDVADGAKLARTGKERALAVQKALAANDFAAAAEAAREVAKSCRACHDVYRP